MDLWPKLHQEEPRTRPGLYKALEWYNSIGLHPYSCQGQRGIQELGCPWIEINIASWVIFLGMLLYMNHIKQFSTNFLLDFSELLWIVGMCLPHT